MSKTMEEAVREISHLLLALDAQIHMQGQQDFDSAFDELKWGTMDPPNAT